MEDDQKSKVLGSTIVMEILEIPDGTNVYVNSTNLRTKLTATGEDYVTYAQKYGTDLLDREISLNSYYYKKVNLDSHGNITSIVYTLS